MSFLFLSVVIPSRIRESNKFGVSLERVLAVKEHAFLGGRYTR